VKGLTILAYHRVHPGRRGALCVTPVGLERQVRLLLRRGLRPVGGADLLRALDTWVEGGTRPQTGSRPAAGAGTGAAPAAGSAGIGWAVPPIFPGPPSFLVTFDDGYADVARYAWPALRRLGVPAVVFLIHDWVGRREPFPWEGKYNPDPGPEDRPLGWEEVRALQSEGCEFASHTLTHPDLDGLAPAQAREEIRVSRLRLQDRLQTRVDLFCYPRGGFRTDLAEAVAESGYRAALLTPRRARLDEHRFCLRRVGVYAADRGMRYQLKVSPFFDALREARLRWISRKAACCS
jgi:peptidoglycan/xylan/chitin deacetylase (PgdA/CDA1 family)